MEKTEFREKAMPAAKMKINVEREESIYQKLSEANARSLTGAAFNPFIDIGRT